MKQASAVLIMVILVTVLASPHASPDCNVVISELTPCVSYLTRTLARPTGQCCNGVAYLSNYSRRKADRMSICQCLERSVSMFPHIDFSLASNLTTDCGVSLPLPPISPTFNCSRA